MTKEMLIQAKYTILAEEAILKCETTKLSFREWVRNYGLYCSGKEIGAYTEALGQALYKAKIGKVTASDKALIDATKDSIAAELMLINSSLNLTPKTK